MGGLEALRRLLAHDAQARVLVLSVHEAIAYPLRVLKLGAWGYLSKRAAAEALIDAVHALARGQKYIDPELGQRMALAQFRGETNPSDLLTEREFAVFLMLAQGNTVSDIAEHLKLSTSTVGTHLYNVKQKLSASNQAELTLIALRWGLIEA